MKLNSIEFIQANLDEVVVSLDRQQCNVDDDIDTLDEAAEAVKESIIKLSEVILSIGGYREIIRAKRYKHKEKK